MMAVMHLLEKWPFSLLCHHHAEMFLTVPLVYGALGVAYIGLVLNSCRHFLSKVFTLVINSSYSWEIGNASTDACKSWVLTINHKSWTLKHIHYLFMLGYTEVCFFICKHDPRFSLTQKVIIDDFLPFWSMIWQTKKTWPQLSGRFIM